MFIVPCLTYAQGDEDGWSGGDPNPTVSIDGLLYKLNTEEHSAKVANGNCWEGELLIPVQGRRVMGQPKPGIYVVDGKKQVVK